MSKVGFFLIIIIKNNKKKKTSHGYPKPRAASVDKDGHFLNSFPNEEQGVGGEKKSTLYSLKICKRLEMTGRRINLVCAKTVVRDCGSGCTT